jgi:intracellular sulfur oxidation DsrE/DsrF family protein
MVSSRALFHLDDGDHRRVETVLRQVETLLADAGADHVDVEVVASGDGLSALRRAPNRYGDAVTQLAAQGVHFVACADAAQRLGLARAALLDPVELVPSGISELVWKRAAGWARMRP